MLIIMLNERKVMRATCISTRGSEAARCVVYFTYFIVRPVGDAGECTDRSFVVQALLTDFWSMLVILKKPKLRRTQVL
jgi:hypothetical protein